MKKVGIIGAMELEVDTLKSKMEVKSTTTKARMEFFEGTLNHFLSSFSLSLLLLALVRGLFPVLFLAAAAAAALTKAIQSSKGKTQNM